MTLLELAVFVVAGVGGAITHELAHWVVWLAAGRKPKLDLLGLEVRPRAGPRRTTLADRMAAVAPYAVGAGVVWMGLEVGSWPLVVFGALTFGLPSGVDVQTMLGLSEWQLDPA